MGETKDFQFEIKSVDEDQFTIEGYASVYDVKDLQDDVMEHGAFSRTMAHKKGLFPFLWAHDKHQPIGGLVISDKDEGIWVKAELNPKVQKACEALALAKQKVVTGLSIGYDTVQSYRAKDGSRHLKEIKLHEVSLVLFPACQEAVVFSAKEDSPNSEIPPESETPAEIKSGRTLSAKTRASMMAAIQALQELMGSTDLEEDSAPAATLPKSNEPDSLELASMVAMCRKWREAIR
jgi:HK97 family phage prohead protease